MLFFPVTSTIAVAHVPISRPKKSLENVEINKKNVRCLPFPEFPLSSVTLRRLGLSMQRSLQFFLDPPLPGPVLPRILHHGHPIRFASTSITTLSTPIGAITIIEYM